MPIVNFHQQVPVELCRKASALVRREATAPRREVPIFDGSGTQPSLETCLCMA
jgi:hypothetical protein